MEHRYAHHRPNPSGRGVDRVADLYVMQDTDLEGKPEASREFTASIFEESTPAALRELMEKILQHGLAAISK